MCFPDSRIFFYSALLAVARIKESFWRRCTFPLLPPDLLGDQQHTFSSFSLLFTSLSSAP